MDKIIAIIVSIIAVVALCVVVIFGGIAPTITQKGKAVETQINGMNTDSIGK
jgi:hypothetical protein